MKRLEIEATCTVGGYRDGYIWLGEFIDVVISRTGFDLDGSGPEGEALPTWRAENLSCDHAIFQPWMGAINPEWGAPTTCRVRRTPLGNLSALSL